MVRSQAPRRRDGNRAPDTLVQGKLAPASLAPDSLAACEHAKRDPATGARADARPAAGGLTIAGLAGAGGVGVETVRFYQRRGLLDRPDRGAGIRRYDAQDLRRLRFIRQAQAAGFTLDQIGELLTLDAGEDRARANALASARIAALDAKIAELQAARDALQRLTAECSTARPGPCPILSAFDT